MSTILVLPPGQQEAPLRDVIAGVGRLRKQLAVDMRLPLGQMRRESLDLARRMDDLEDGLSGGRLESLRSTYRLLQAEGRLREAAACRHALLALNTQVTTSPVWKKAVGRIVNGTVRRRDRLDVEAADNARLYDRVARLHDGLEALRRMGFRSLELPAGFAPETADELLGILQDRVLALLRPEAGGQTNPGLGAEFGGEEFGNE